MGEKGTLISKQQLFDEFLIGFCAREEMLKVEETAVCSEMDVDAIWQVGPLSLWSMMLKKMENNVGARMHPCLMPLEIGKQPD